MVDRGVHRIVAGLASPIEEELRTLRQQRRDLHLPLPRRHLAPPRLLDTERDMKPAYTTSEKR